MFSVDITAAAGEKPVLHSQFLCCKVWQLAAGASTAGFRERAVAADLDRELTTFRYPAMTPRPESLQRSTHDGARSRERAHRPEAPQNKVCRSTALLRPPSPPPPPPRDAPSIRQKSLRHREEDRGLRGGPTGGPGRSSTRSCVRSEEFKTKLIIMFYYCQWLFLNQGPQFTQRRDYYVWRPCTTHIKVIHYLQLAP